MESVLYGEGRALWFFGYGEGGGIYKKQRKEILKGHTDVEKAVSTLGPLVKASRTVRSTGSPVLFTTSGGLPSEPIHLPVSRGPTSF